MYRFNLFALSALGLVFCLHVGSANAGTFATGSTGADGVLDVTDDMEVTLPADGILNYASVTVRAGKVLTFTRNARNTPVFLLSQGDIVLEASARVSVDGEDGRINGLGGRGGNGGFGGGSQIDTAQLPGAGQGPGGAPAPVTTTSWGSHAGYGQIGSAQFGPPGEAYGSQLLLPLIGGSGGSAGNGYGGGGGGGAILLASDTRIALAASSTITAVGVSNPQSTGQGSGGAVRLVAPIVEGTGILTIRGGGPGRARVDTLFNTSLNITRLPSNAPYTIGSMMLAFLDIEPQIDILGIGQESIPLGHNGEFLVLLPSGSGSTQDVTIQLTDFTGSVPIRMTLTPEVGPILTYDLTVDMSDAVDGEKSVDITGVFPLNISTFVHVWTVPVPATP
ncbi:MAG: hypothetical protein ACI9MR_005065 [Myxococcota bacterium]|jgi:hypothetical protein